MTSHGGAMDQPLSNDTKPHPLGPAVRTHGLHLGANVETGRAVHLSSAWWGTHLHVLGPSGVGKTRLLLWLFRQFCEVPRAAIVVLSPKGGFVPMAARWAIASGFARRLVLIDPGQPYVVGYNPLQPNGLSVATQAKAVREAIRAAWGQASFDTTPQLARFLYLVLCVAREQQLTLIEAVSLLRPNSPVRTRVLASVQDPCLREALAYFDSLRAQRQEELAASTLARLEAFVMDPSLRAMFARREACLDIPQVVRNGGILLINLQVNRPLRLDDVKLLGRLLLNDVIGAAFARDDSECTPLYLVVDEVETFATADLCNALDQGRELGVSCVLAHQDVPQLDREDPSGQLRAAVLHNARTKIVFGGGWADDLTPFIEHLFLDQWDPRAVKDERIGLELEPVESQRTQRTITRSVGITVGSSRTRGRSTGTAKSEGDSESYSVVDGFGSGTFRPEDGLPAGSNENSFSSTSFTQTRSKSRTTSKIDQRSTTSADSRQRGRGVSITEVPFYEYIKRRVVTSRTYWTAEEFFRSWKQLVLMQPVGHFVLKVPSKPAVFVRAPSVIPPFVAGKYLARMWQLIFAKPFYLTAGLAETAALPRPALTPPDDDPFE